MNRLQHDGLGLTDCGGHQARIGTFWGKHGSLLVDLNHRVAYSEAW